MADLEPEAATVFGVVMLTSDGEFKTETFPTVDKLVARLTELVDKDVSVSCFSGTLLPVSKPPFRHLLTPWGNKPLFALPQTSFEQDDSGYLGVDPIHLAGPAQIPLRPAPQQSGDDDEFFNDDSGETLDIFNGVLPDPEN